MNHLSMKHVWTPRVWGLPICRGGLAALSVAFTTAGWAATSLPWPDVPAPPQSRVQWVAKDVWLNGIPTRIQSFESSTEGVAQVLAHYRAHWRSADLPPSERNMGHWASIGRLHGPYSMVVQVKPLGLAGSQGLISVMNLRALKSKYLPPDWPPHPDMRVVQVMESVDGAKQSHYLVAQSDKETHHVRGQLQRAWDQRGWHLRHEQVQATAYWGTYERLDSTLDLLITSNARQKGVSVIVNFVQSAGE